MIPLGMSGATLLTLLGPLLIVASALAYFWVRHQTATAEAAGELAQTAKNTADTAATTVGILSEEISAYKARAERLGGELSHATQVMAAQLAQIENLRASRDLAPVMEKLSKIAAELGSRHIEHTVAIEKLADNLQLHDERMMERNEQELKLLKLLCERVDGGKGGSRTTR